MAMEILDFEALWDLIESRFTSHLYKRHIIAINRICEKRKNGIFLDELTQFTKLLNLCKDHIENDRLEFLTATINLLSVTLKPYITAKSFEKIECFDIIKQHFELISCLLSKKYMFITITISVGIQNYIHDVLDYKVINESGIIEELVDGIRSWCYGARWKLEENHKEIKNKNEHILNIELSLELIRTIKVLSYSEQCVITLVDKSNILDLKILYDVEMNDIFLTNSIESLWNIIETAPFELISKYIETDYFNIFTLLLTKYMKEINISNKTNHKQLRNCILSIILILSKHESMHKYFERSHIIHILLKYCYYTLNNNHFGCNHQDFQLLCIIYNIIHRICKCYRILSVLIKEKFIDNIVDILFIDNNSLNIKYHQKWTPTQITNIRIEIIFIFQTLIQFVPKYFFKNKIINKLFQFFVYHQQSISHHHSINKQIDNVSKSLLRFFAKCLYKTTNTNKYNLNSSNQIIAESLQQILNIDYLCNILLRIINHVSFKQVTRTDAVLIISYLTKLNIENNKFNNEYGQDIIKCICNLLNILPSLTYYDEFQHSLIKCLRNIMYSNKLNQTIFFNQNGVSILINLIQKSQPSIIENAMNLLLQLSSNKQFNVLLAQKCKNSDENKNFQTILFNVWDKCENNCTDRMSLSVMRSIYCLFVKLRSIISSQNINIDPVEQHKITKILNHSQLIQGKAWRDLEEELNKELIELTTADSIDLSFKVNKYNKIKSQLCSAESSLKIVANRKFERNLNDLMNKLNLYKSQKIGDKHSMNRHHPKEHVLASTIKLNKDQKDEIVAKSLQLNETMKKVLGEL